MGGICGKSEKTLPSNRQSNLISESLRHSIHCDFRIVLAGPTKVGKTSFFKSYMNDPQNPFTDNDLDTNYDQIASNNIFRMIKINRKRLNVNLWDLAGDLASNIKNLTKVYFRDAHGVILLFDLTDRESLEKVKKEWIPFIRETLGLDNLKSKELKMMRTPIDFNLYKYPLRSCDFEIWKFVILKLKVVFINIRIPSNQY